MNPLAPLEPEQDHDRLYVVFPPDEERYEQLARFRRISRVGWLLAGSATTAAISAAVVFLLLGGPPLGWALLGAWTVGITIAVVAHGVFVANFRLKQWLEVTPETVRWGWITWRGRKAGTESCPMQTVSAECVEDEGQIWLVVKGPEKEMRCALPNDQASYLVELVEHGRQQARGLQDEREAIQRDVPTAIQAMKDR